MPPSFGAFKYSQEWKAVASIARGSSSNLLRFFALGKDITQEKIPHTQETDNWKYNWKTLCFEHLFDTNYSLKKHFSLY